MKLLKRLLFIILLLLALGAAGLGLDLFPNMHEAGLPYRVDKVTRGTIADIITATGSITPEEIITVGTQVSGQITAVYVALNDEVKAGQLLAEIDPAIAKTQLKQSKANMETAQLAYELSTRDYNRTKTLLEKDYVAKVDLERAEQVMVSARNNLESAKIQVERDEVNLGYTKVTAPIGGIIIAQEVASGQTVASNYQTPNLFSIAKDLTSMKINVNLPESDISKIKKDMPVAFMVDAFPDRIFNGNVQTIGLNPNNQLGVVTYTVVVKVDNKDKALLPGMTANITITLSEKTDVLRVPASALRFTPPKQKINPLKALLTGGNSPTATDASSGGQSIYLWVNNKLKQVPVFAGKSDDLYVEIVSDQVKEGDIVVVGLLPTSN